MFEKLDLNITEPKFFKFNVFDAPPCTNLDEGDVNFSTSVNCYNFCYDKGRLTSGYGVRELQMPTSKTDLETESIIPVKGDEVRALWSFTWYEKTRDELKYYLFYFNEDGQFCYDNILFIRPLTLYMDSQFTTTPVGINYRYGGEDMMVFSAADCDSFVISNNGGKHIENAPRLVSLCIHNDRLYAITGQARRELVYTDNLNIEEWDESKTKRLDLSDDRGNLTKVMSFGDYVYVFREFGISKISTYATSGEFNVSHIFQSSSYIYPGSIASDGETVYFLTRDGFYAFNGSSVKRIKLDCLNMFEDNVSCNAICFESKYYLACRLDFNDDLQLGCEAAEGGYINNAIFIYDTTSDKVEFVRGVDVKQLLALNNPYKSKVVMCFNGANIGKLGELTKAGQFFGSYCHKVWESPMNEFGSGEKVKKIESFTIKTNVPCQVTLFSERTNKTFEVLPKVKIQRIKAGILGKRFKISIASDGGEETEISNLSISVR